MQLHCMETEERLLRSIQVETCGLALVYTYIGTDMVGIAQVHNSLNIGKGCSREITMFKV